MSPTAGPAGRYVALFAVLLVVTAGPAAAVVPSPVPGDGSEPLASSAWLVDASSLGDPRDPVDAWFQWTEHVAVEELSAAARAHAPESGAALVPTPDAFTGYNMASGPEKREAWRAWWIATEITASRVPTQPLSGLGEAGGASQGQGENGGGGAPSGGEGLGSPRGLDRLWGLEAHGAPRALLPSGGDGSMFLVTDLGVVHLPGPNDRPDWMLRLDNPPSRAQVVPEGDGRMLVVGTPVLFGDASRATIHVVDGGTQQIGYQGRSGEKALLHWRLTDVDGDGALDVLGVDVSRNITAFKLDGTEIYREPIPEPDVPVFEGLPDEPESPLSGFLAIALERTGAPVFGDATGDGTLDLFSMAEYWVDTEGLLDLSLGLVSAVDGTNAQIAWTQVFEPEQYSGRFFLPGATGDLNGDGSDDLVVTERKFRGPIGVSPSLVNTVVSGLTGTLLARDDAREVCSAECVPLGMPYEPVAVVERGGDASPVVVGLEHDSQSLWNPPPALVLRALQEVPLPGLPTQEVDRHGIESTANGFPFSGHVQVREMEGSGVGVVILFESTVHPGSPTTGKVHRLVGDEFTTIDPSEPIGHYDVDVATGQAYAWTLEDDKWVPVSDGPGWSREGNGTQMLRSSRPLLVFDRDDDGAGDLLLSRSLGYQWVDGQNGEIVERLDRPSDTRALFAVESDDGAFVLEEKGRGVALFDLGSGREVWTVSEENREGMSIRAVGDFTGEDGLEILARRFPTFSGGFGGGRDGGGIPELEPGSWEVQSPGNGKTLWELEGDDLEVVALDAVPGSEGLELAVVEPDGSGTQVSLFRVDEEEALWERDYDEAEVLNAKDGQLVVLATDGEGDYYEVVDGQDGAVYYETRLEPGQDALWGRLMELDSKGPYLVHSYAQDLEGLPGARQQFVSVADPQTGEALTELELTDPQVRTFTFAGGETRSFVRYAQPGPLVGDWDGGGWQDLALLEGGSAVVRSLRDGELLALAPAQGAFATAQDMTGDGRKEVVLQSQGGGSLRVYAFDPSQVDLEREDPLARFDQDAGNETDGNDVDDRRSPEPGVALLLAFAWVGLGLARRVARSYGKRSGV